MMKVLQQHNIIYYVLSKGYNVFSIFTFTFITILLELDETTEIERDTL